MSVNAAIIKTKAARASPQLTPGNAGINLSSILSDKNNKTSGARKTRIKLSVLGTLKIFERKILHLRKKKKNCIKIYEKLYTFYIISRKNF